MKGFSEVGTHGFKAQNFSLASPKAADAEGCRGNSEITSGIALAGTSETCPAPNLLFHLDTLCGSLEGPSLLDMVQVPWMDAD